MNITPFFLDTKRLYKNWIVALSVRISVASVIASVGFFLWKLRALPTLVPLWYSRPWGAEQLAHPLWLLLLPAGSLLWLFISTLAAFYVSAGMLLFTQTMFLSSGIVGIMSFVALVKILFLIT